MEQAQGRLLEGADGESEQMGERRAQQQATPFSRPDPLAPADPFADLLELSFSRTPKPASEAAPAATSAGSRPISSRSKPATSAQGESVGSGMAPVTIMEGSLAAKKRKSQESRQKRDQFLDQMSSFLEGIESNTAEVVPPEPPASFASPPAQPRPPRTEPPRAKATTHSLWPSPTSERKPAPIPSVFPSSTVSSPFPPTAHTAAAGSSLMQEDLPAPDPFLTAALPSANRPKSTGDLRAVIAASNDSHPQGSLFDDEIDLEEADAVEEDAGNQARGNIIASDFIGSSPPKRVTPSPVPFSVPPINTRPSVLQSRSRSKAKNSRGLDLEEVRRRTSLLSGGGGASPPPVQAAAPSRSSAPRPPDTLPYFDAGWRRQQASTASLPSSEAPHPLHAAPVDPLFSSGMSGGTFDDRGNYFNEDLLLARGQGSKAEVVADPLEDQRRSRGGGQQGPWRGDALMDSAGNMLNTARDGAKTLLRDAKAGVDAVGASWQNANEKNGRKSERNGSSLGAKRSQEPRGLRKQKSVDEPEFEATFGEGRLGFTLFREEMGPRKGKGVVCKVHQGGTAQTLGVQLGDAVSGVNKRRYDTYDEVMEVLPKLPRPVLITFSRGGAALSAGSDSGLSAAARRASAPSENARQQSGGNPLEWLAKLNPFDKQKGDGEDEQRGERRNSADASADGKISTSHEYGLPGEAFARGLAGGVFSWSYYGTSDGIETNTKDTYTEHVMRCQWGRTADTMQSWMVARRYREFDALDHDLRDSYPDRKDALPRLPPKEFFKMAPDVVERRTKGLEMYMTTIVRRFPDMLESPHLDRFLTISERLSSFQAAPVATAAAANSSQALSYRNLGAHGSSSNVFIASEHPMDTKAKSATSALVGTDYILNLMSSKEAYRLSQARHVDPIEVGDAESLIAELENHLASISPTAHLLSDAKLYGLVEQCQQCWPRVKASAAAAVAGEISGNSETLLPRIVQCDEGMERAFERLKGALATRGYM